MYQKILLFICFYSKSYFIFKDYGSITLWIFLLYILGSIKSIYLFLQVYTSKLISHVHLKTIQDSICEFSYRHKLLVFSGGQVTESHPFSWILLSILVDLKSVVIWMFSICPWISDSSTFSDSFYRVWSKILKTESLNFNFEISSATYIIKWWCLDV